MNNNSIHIIPNIKASLIACFFLCSNLSVFAQHWHFHEKNLKAYDMALNLQLDEVRQHIPKPNSNQEHYVVALAQALELLITEDNTHFAEYEEQFKQILERDIKTASPEEHFLQAELHMQWTFVYLKFGHELDAGLHMRQAYFIVQDCKKNYPDYIAIKKTSGLLDLIIGSIPEKYEWVLGLLGMQGSIDFGFKELESVELADSHLGFEAELLHALVQGFILQKTEVAVTEITNVLKKHPDNKLVLFFAAALSIKNAQSEDAIDYLHKLTASNTGIPIYYAYYLLGEVYLHKADYLSAITSYRWFIKHYKGENYIKDANYKIGLCYLLHGNTNDGIVTLKAAKTIGKEVVEADKYAARSIAETELPNVPLTKARYYTDGGYYTEAKALLDALTPGDLPTKRDQVEFVYRKARLAHKTNQLTLAKQLYLQTIDMTGNEHWYFAPNSCLQLGYIFEDEKQFPDAITYFNRALNYKTHEYKNSIDSKAKSALSQIKKRK